MKKQTPPAKEPKCCFSGGFRSSGCTQGRVDLLITHLKQVPRLLLCLLYPSVPLPFCFHHCRPENALRTEPPCASAQPPKPMVPSRTQHTITCARASQKWLFTAGLLQTQHSVCSGLVSCARHLLAFPCSSHLAETGTGSVEPVVCVVCTTLRNVQYLGLSQRHREPGESGAENPAPSPEGRRRGPLTAGLPGVQGPAHAVTKA